MAVLLLLLHWKLCVTPAVTYSDLAFYTQCVLGFYLVLRMKTIIVTPWSVCWGGG
jgi:hypothetical protein